MIMIRFTSEIGKDLESLFSGHLYIWKVMVAMAIAPSGRKTESFSAAQVDTPPPDSAGPKICLDAKFDAKV